MKIVPAILTDTLDALQQMLDQAATFCDYAQIDFMDGRFVPSVSVAIEEVASVRIPLPVEAHLMVEEPRNLEPLAKAGVRQAIIHFEACADPLFVLNEIKSLGMLAGMAVNPETNLEDFYDLVKHLDSVLVMTVDPGFYGSTFQPEALAKAATLKRRLKDVPAVAPSVGVDGGIGPSNVDMAAAASLDFACVGSAIFRSSDPAAAYRDLLSIVDGS